MAPIDRADHRREDVPLQAVVLAETFCSKFQPITTESCPFALLPLQGRPLIDYNLDLLFTNGFQEVYVFCHSHNAEHIKSYLSSSKWASFGPHRFAVKVISADNYMSFGDMLRDLDGKAYIRSDFLLLQAGVIANIDIKQLLQAHRGNQLASNGKSLMTIVVRKLSPAHGTRSVDEHFVVFLDADRKILHAHFNERRTKYLDVPLRLFAGGAPVSVRADLTQTKMVFCSQHVPAIFSDNFDYQDTNDFVKGIIEHEEIMNNSIHIYEVQNSYCACITNLTLYTRIALDIAKRWTYPYTVDNNVRGCRLQRGGYYMGVKGRVAPSASIAHFSVVLGTVAEETKVNRSFIGEGSTVGTSCQLHEVTLGKNVVIEDRCVLNHCLIGDNCVVYHDTSLSGCILAAGVRVGPSKQLNLLRLQSVSYDDGFGDDLDGDSSKQVNAATAVNTTKFGTKSIAFEFAEEADDDSECEDVDDDALLEDKWGTDGGGQAGLSDGFVSEDEDDTETIEGHGDVDEVDAGEYPVEGTEDTNLFLKEVLESLQRGVEENIRPENLILEINSSKHAYNVTITEVIEITVRALLSICLSEKKTAESFMAGLKKSTNQVSGILRNYLKKEDSQRICLDEIRRFYVRLRSHGDEALLKTMQNVINFLYQKDVLSESAILDWFDDLSEDDVAKKYLTQFVEWLQQDSSAEEQSDDDDGDDGHDDSEDAEAESSESD